MQRLNRSAMAASVQLVACLFAAGCTRTADPSQASFVREVEWAETGVWLKADTHVHTQFSDGGVEVADVVRRSYLERLRRSGNHGPRGSPAESHQR